MDGLVSTPNPLDFDALVRPLKRATIDGYVVLFRRFALRPGAAGPRADRGGDRPRGVLRGQLLQGRAAALPAGRTSAPAIPGTATAFRIARRTAQRRARHLVRVEAAVQKDIDLICRRLDPQQPRTMGKRNRDRLARFDDPENVRLALGLPGGGGGAGAAHGQPVPPGQGRRARNLATIEIGTQLTITARGATLTFSENETKNRQPLVHPLPRHLVSSVQAYLDRVRPSFRPVGDCKRLWLGFEGEPLAAHSVYGRIILVTDRLLGVKINPHSFRSLRRHQPRQPLVGRCPPRRAAARPPLLRHHRAALHHAPDSSRRAARFNATLAEIAHQPWPEGISMTRAAVYARYSSDLSRDASIEDQVRLCRAFAERADWTGDASLRGSGDQRRSSVRPGSPPLLASGLAGKFDVVLAEALRR